MKSFIIYIFFLISLFFTCAQICAQNDQKYLWNWNEEHLVGVKPQLVGIQPEGFVNHLIYSITSTGRRDVTFDEVFSSNDQRFLIVFSVHNFPLTSKDSIIVNILNPEFPKISMDSLYLNRVEKDLRFTMGDKYDSMKKNLIKYYSEEDAKLKFNADHALTYPLFFNKKRRYHDQSRKYCEVLILHKSGRGHVVMYCYYDKKRQKNECLKIAEGIFRYREPEEFIEYSDKDIEIPLNLNKKQ